MAGLTDIDPVAACGQHLDPVVGHVHRFAEAQDDAVRRRVELVADTLYPVHFAVPSAVRRHWAPGVNSGMAHQTSPWAGVAVEGSPLG